MHVSMKLNLKSVLIVLLVIVLIISFPFGVRVWRLYSFAGQREAGIEVIENLRLRCPENVEEVVWDQAISWTRTAYYNVFSSIDNPTSKDLIPFISEVKVRLNEKIDMESIDWIWSRLALTGPYGREYVDRIWQEYKATVRDRNSENHSSRFRQ